MKARRPAAVMSLIPALVAMLCATTSAQAQAPAYPNKPVRLVAGFPAGGGVDATARTYRTLSAAELAEQQRARAAAEAKAKGARK